MGNIENREEKQSQGKLKSLKDILNDIKIMNDIFEDESFISDLKAIVRVELEPDPSSLVTKVLYKVIKNIKFRLSVMKDYKTDIIELDLHNFYLLYSSTVKFSLEMLNSIPKQNKKIEKEEQKENFWSKTLPPNFNKNQIDFQMKRNNQSKTDEDTFCTICLEKEIQIVLPCLHGFCEKCCFDWYTKKSKNECPLCRNSLSDGNWRGKVFEVINKISTIEGRSQVANEIAAFINFRSNNVVV